MDQDARIQLGAAARERIQRHFSLRQVVDEYEQLLPLSG
jgi:hypothetical protein